MLKADTITLYSSVKPALLQKTIYRGTIIAALGILPMLYASIYLDTPTLSRWGVLIFFGSLGLIALGLLPYRRLTALDQKPNKLVFNEKGEFTYYQRGLKTFTVPLTSIEKVSYRDETDKYGLALDLEENPDKKIVIHNRLFDYYRYQAHCRKRYACDLFLPYFSKNTYNEVRSLLKSRLDDVVHFDDAEDRIVF